MSNYNQKFTKLTRINADYILSEILEVLGLEDNSENELDSTISSQMIIYEPGSTKIIGIIKREANKITIERIDPL